MKTDFGVDSPVHILLVSCRAPFGDEYRVNLALAGFRVSTSSVPDTVPDLVRRDRPDVILLDPDSSLIDGWNLLGELKTDPSLADVPVMLLTSSVEESDELQALERGATVFLAKPISVDDVVQCVRRVRRQTSTSTRRPAPS